MIKELFSNYLNEQDEEETTEPTNDTEKVQTYGQVGDDAELGDAASELDDEVEVETDPDYQGIIRTIPDAHLVYKRENGEGAYDELWVYNVDTMKDELKIRRNILAGTDIPENKTHSPDGSQYFTLATMGNAQMLFISGLPN